MAGWYDFVNGQTLPASRVQDYLMDQSVMVFDDAAARTSALPTPTEGMVTYLTDVKKLFVYKNAWTQVIDNDNIPSGNQLINGGFDVWQRGTSFTGTSPYYGADRWQTYRAGAVAGSTYSRQSASLDGFTYAVRLQRDSGNTNTNYVRLATSLETTQVRTLWGEPLVLSFYARAGANLSSTSNQIVVTMHGGTGTDGSLGGGFTSRTTLATSTTAITTSWVRYELSLASLSNTYTQFGVSIEFNPTGTAGASDYIEVTGVQLETGLIATPFQRAASTLQGELAACQRYYWRTSSMATSGLIANGSATSTTNARMTVKHPVTMRTSPSSLEFSTIAISDGATGFVPSAITLTGGGQTGDTAMVDITVTGATQFRPYYLLSNGSTSAFLGFSAEL